MSLEKSEVIHFEKKEGLLTCAIKSSKREDAGCYTLKCKNDSGLAETEAKLTVNGKFISSFRNIT